MPYQPIRVVRFAAAAAVHSDRVITAASRVHQATDCVTSECRLAPQHGLKRWWSRVKWQPRPAPNRAARDTLACHSAEPDEYVSFERV